MVRAETPKRPCRNGSLRRVEEKPKTHPQKTRMGHPAPSECQYMPPRIIGGAATRGKNKRKKTPGGRPAFPENPRSRQGCRRHIGKMKSDIAGLKTRDYMGCRRAGCRGTSWVRLASVRWQISSGEPVAGMESRRPWLR